MSVIGGYCGAGALALAAALAAAAAQAGAADAPAPAAVSSPRAAGLATAGVESVRGKVTATTSAGARPGSAVSAGVALAPGSTLGEGTRLRVPSDGYLRLRLADGSVVRVLADSDVELKRLRGRHPDNPHESVIEVHQGKVEAEVARQHKDRSFEIQAPGVVASVRGTCFDVAVYPDGRAATTVSEGVVVLHALQHDGARGPGLRLVAGQRAVTDVHGRIGPLRTLPAMPDLALGAEVSRGLRVQAQPV